MEFLAHGQLCIHQCPWMPMDVHRCSWMLMEVYRCPWMTISVHQYQVPFLKRPQKAPSFGWAPLAVVWVMGHIMMSAHMSIKKEDKAQVFRNNLLHAAN